MGEIDVLRTHFPGGGMHRPRLGSPSGAALLITVSILVLPQALAAQEAVESAGPRDPDLTLAAEPLLRVGIVDGPLEYIFGDVDDRKRRGG